MTKTPHPSSLTDRFLRGIGLILRYASDGIPGLLGSLLGVLGHALEWLPAMYDSARSLPPYLRATPARFRTRLRVARRASRRRARIQRKRAQRQARRLRP